MGAGASLPPDVPQWLDEAKCREVCGDRFDEDAFKRLAGKQGKIQKQQLVAAARRQQAKPTAKPPAAAGTARPNYGGAAAALKKGKGAKSARKAAQSAVRPSAPSEEALAATEADVDGAAAAPSAEAPVAPDEAAAATPAPSPPADPLADAAARFEGAPEELVGSARVHFSHYRKEFPVRDGVVRWADIDEEYCISFVYRGAFARALERSDGAAPHEGAAQPVPAGPHPEYWTGVAPSAVYELHVTEDAEAGVGIEGLVSHKGPLKLGATAEAAGAGASGNRQTDLLTQELKAMSSEQLKEAGDEYQRLKEARDVEDVLFSGGG